MTENKMLDEKDLKNKWNEWFSLEKLGAGLGWLGIGFVIVIIVDKIFNMGEKLKPFYERYIKGHGEEFPETIDSVGDNIQLISFFLNEFGIDINLKPLGDFLQNLGTGSKHIIKLMNLAKSKMGSIGQGQRSGSTRTI